MNRPPPPPVRRGMTFPPRLPDRPAASAALTAAGLALCGYVAVLHVCRVPVGAGELLGGGLLAASVGLNVAKWLWRRDGDAARERRAAWALRTLLPPFNLLLGAAAAVALAEAALAGRNLAGAAVVAAWSVGPGLFALHALGTGLADRVLFEGDRLVPAPALPPPRPPFLPTDGH